MYPINSKKTLRHQLDLQVKHTKIANFGPDVVRIRLFRRL